MRCVGSVYSQELVVKVFPSFAMCLQDTCTGFLLGGIGEMNNKREPNFLVVDKGEEEDGKLRVVKKRGDQGW